MDKIAYNKKTAKELGWSPNWFGSSVFDDSLIENIKKAQRDWGITDDGLVGPSTFRRIYTKKEAEAENLISDTMLHHNTILCGTKMVPINWSKVNVYVEPDSLKVNRFKPVKEKVRKPNMFVLHWDVCLSSSSCVDVLNKRGLSVHFSIDNDGTIHQLMNTQDIAYHAGSRVVNNNSIGVEISNAYYTKYNKIYKDRGFGERTLVNNVKVHNIILKEHLDFYPIQLDALKALTKALNVAYDIPLVCPMDGDSQCITEHEDVKSGAFNGVVNHYNITKNKIDCAGLDLPKLLKEI